MDLNLGKAAKDKLKTKAMSHHHLKDHLGCVATAQAYGDDFTNQVRRKKREQET